MFTDVIPIATYKQNYADIYYILFSLCKSFIVTFNLIVEIKMLGIISIYIFVDLYIATC